MTDDPTIRPLTHLRALVRDYPDLGKQVDHLRSLRGSELPLWPDWCLLPVGAWATIVHERGVTDPMMLGSDLMRLAGIGTWRYTQGVYALDPALLAALADTPLTGVIPSDALLRLPEWAVYVPMAGDWEGSALHGFWASLEWDAGSDAAELRILTDSEGGLGLTTIPLGPWTIREGIEQSFARLRKDAMARRDDIPDAVLAIAMDPDTPRIMAEQVAPLISILLYLCSDQPEIEADREPGISPGNPRPTRIKRGWRLFPPSQPRVWHVGHVTGDRLRADRAEWQSTGRHVRPHIRRGHWHGFWRGPRNGERTFVYHWLPPMLVAAPED